MDYEYKELISPHDDALVISILIANFLTKRVLIDNGSFANVIFLDALTEMRIEESAIIRQPTTLYGFSGEKKFTVGSVTLHVYAEGSTFLPNSW